MMVAKMAHEAVKIWLKMNHRCPKMAPKWPKMAPRWPKMAPNGPKMAPSGTKMAQDGPEMARRWPPETARCTKMPVQVSNFIGDYLAMSFFVPAFIVEVFV